MIDRGPLTALAVAVALIPALSGCEQGGFGDPRAAKSVPVAGRPAAPHPVNVSVPVERGQAVELELPPGVCHIVEIPLAVGESAVFSIEQRGVDLITRVIEPSGDEAMEVDAPVQETGLDRGVWIAESAGIHRLEICAGDEEEGGPYRIELESPLLPDDVLRDRAAGFVHYARGRRLTKENDPEGARLAFEEALERWRAAGDLYGCAWAWSKLGSLAHSERDPSRAATAYGQAAGLYGEVGDDRAVARAALFEAFALMELDRDRGALNAYRLARAAAERAGDPMLERGAVEGLARAQMELDEPLEALVLLQELLENPRFSHRPSDRVRALYWQGLLYQRLGESERALDLYERALPVAEAEGLADDRAKLLLALGGAHLDLERFGAADELLAEAQRVEEKYGDSYELPWILSRRGRLFTERGELGRARGILDRALGIGLERGDGKLVGEVRINRARLASREGDHETAIALCRQALTLLDRVEERLWSASSLNCLADNLAAAGRLEEAQEAIEEAISRVESVRRRPAPGSVRASLLADKREYYGRLIDILLRRHREAPAGGFATVAFEVAERSRSRTLLDEIRRAAVELRGRSDPELLERSEALAAEMTALEGRLFRDGGAEGGGDGAELRARIEALKDARGLIEARLEAALPGSEVTAIAKPADLSTIRSELLAAGDTQILAYFLGEEASTAWLVGADVLTVRRLPDRATIETLARRAARLMAESDARHRRLQARLAAEELARVVIGPFADELTASRLRILPDGALHGIPFVAMPTASQEDASLLGERFEITVLPSASVGVALRGRPRAEPSRGELVVVADPVFEPNDPRLADPPARAFRESGRSTTTGAVTRAAGGDSLRRLVETRREAEAIARLVPPAERRLLLGLDADRRRVLDGGVSGYRMVHFATHGLVLGELSGLVLSQVDSLGRPVDGLLRSWEVYDLGLEAELVVLSACRTGLGHYLEGEGVMGLARAFLAAGSRQVLVSLWDVDDRATAALMEHFYGAYLGRGLPPSRALREAQLEIRGRPEWSAPHYWAGFVVQGTSD